MRKVQLILIDGMRSDSLTGCGSPDAMWLLAHTLHTLAGQTVVPPVTLPCHMSLFHSVDPARHGVTTNVYTPQVRPIDGLFECLGRKYHCGMYYNWEELRDVSRPGSLAEAVCFSQYAHGFERSNAMVIEAAIRGIREHGMDMTFTYLGWADEAGHEHGWMSEPYLLAVRESLRCVRQLIAQAPPQCITIVLADHGGHDRTHGLDIPEDMTIPVMIHGMEEVGEMTKRVSIKDIAPTLAALMDCPVPKEWEGQNLISYLGRSDSYA